MLSEFVAAAEQPSQTAQKQLDAASVRRLTDRSVSLPSKLKHWVCNTERDVTRLMFPNAVIDWRRF